MTNKQIQTLKTTLKKRFNARLKEIDYQAKRTSPGDTLEFSIKFTITNEATE